MALPAELCYMWGRDRKGGENKEWSDSEHDATNKAQSAGNLDNLSRCGGFGARPNKQNFHGSRRVKFASVATLALLAGSENPKIGIESIILQYKA